jgi:hypothetical protein
MSEPTVCSICGVWNDHHDYEHLARECYPKRIEELELALREMTELAQQLVHEDWSGTNYFTNMISKVNKARAVLEKKP